jgi:hypothetical protein
LRDANDANGEKPCKINGFYGRDVLANGPGWKILAQPLCHRVADNDTPDTPTTRK